MGARRAVAQIWGRYAEPLRRPVDLAARLQEEVAAYS